MPKKWTKVPMNASAVDCGETVIRFTRGTKGDAMASVERLEWFEPDGHEHTGYVAATEGGRRPAADVIAEFKKSKAVVALESEDLWNLAWGELV